MSKFKVGDYVMILPRKEGQETRGPNYIDSMLQHEGKLLRIRDIIKDTCYLEGNGYIWHEDWLEPAFIEPAFKIRSTKMSKIPIPENTEITTYFRYRNRTFGLMNLPNGKELLKIVHIWSDGEIMNFGYNLGEGDKSDLNPLHIIKLYDKKVSRNTMLKHIRDFLKEYNRNNECVGTPEDTLEAS